MSCHRREQSISGDYFPSLVEHINGQRRLPSTAIRSDVEAQEIVEHAISQSTGRTFIPSRDDASAVVICDPGLEDTPVIYASPQFETLTGYAVDEVVGRNCRFLQRPNLLTPGRFVGPLPAYNGYDERRALLKHSVQQGTEQFVSIINYHKSGHAFLNGVTILPVVIGHSRYYVGFLTRLSPPGNQEDSTPALINGWPSDPGQPRDEAGPNPTREPSTSGQLPGPLPANLVSQTTLVSSRNWENGEAVARLLLNHAGVITCVLSVSLRILFASGSVFGLLGYAPVRLNGSAFCDLVYFQDITATRNELRNLTPGAHCSLICRVVKEGGDVIYVDFVASRTLDTDRAQAFIVLTGQIRPALMLPPQCLEPGEENVHPALWAKLSMTGIILYATSALRSLFQRHASPGQSPGDVGVIGLTFQNRMCQPSRLAFERALIKLAASRASTVKLDHCFESRNGIKLVMQTVLILPAKDHRDATNTLKPAVILAQMRYTFEGDSMSFQSDSTPSDQLRRRVTHASCHPTCVARSVRSSNDGTAQSVSGRGTVSQTFQREWSTSRGHAKSWQSTSNSETGAGAEATCDDFFFGFDPPPSLSVGEDVVSLWPQDSSACWQYTIRSLAMANIVLEKECHEILARRSKKRRKVRAHQPVASCTNCHASESPEWRRGPSGHRDLCNRCGIRYAKILRDKTGTVPQSATEQDIAIATGETRHTAEGDARVHNRDTQDDEDMDEADD